MLVFNTHKYLQVSWEKNEWGAWDTLGTIYTYIIAQVEIIVHWKHQGWTEIITKYLAVIIST